MICILIFKFGLYNKFSHVSAFQEIFNKDRTDRLNQNCNQIKCELGKESKRDTKRDINFSVIVNESYFTWCFEARHFEPGHFGPWCFVPEVSQLDISDPDISYIDITDQDIRQMNTLHPHVWHMDIGSMCETSGCEMSSCETAGFEMSRYKMCIKYAR